MKALRIHAQRDIRIEDIPAPELAPGKVLLRGGYTGICGSDLHLYHAPDAFPWDFSKPARLTGAAWPQILGHEFSGEVTAVGDAVEGINIGDKVCVFPYHTCGECVACQTGESIACRHIAFEGIQGQSGGMAEIKIVDAALCMVLPEPLDLKMGALVEPMAVGWRGVSLTAPKPDDTALVVGAGPIGLGAYFALKARGVERIVVSEPSAARRTVLEGLGVEHLIDPAATDLGDYVRSLTKGHGAAMAFDCAGVERAFTDAMMALGLNGKMIVLASYAKPIAFHPTILSGGKSVRMSATYTRQDFAEVIEAMREQRYCTDGWIDVVSLEGVEEAIHDLTAGKRMKVLVESPL